MAQWGSKGTLGPPLFHEVFGKRGQKPQPSPKNKSGGGAHPLDWQGGEREGSMGAF